MKLLRLTHTFSPTAGGPIEGIRQMSPRLRDKGISTTIATLDAPDASLPLDPSYEIVPLGPETGLLGSSKKFDDWLRENLNRFDAAIVHGLWLYNGYGFWKSNQTAKIPYFLYPHGMLDPWFKRAYPRKHLKKSIYWLLRERKLARDAQTLLFTSEEERLLARQTFRPYTVKERVVKYGIASPPFARSESIDAFQALYPQTQSANYLLFLSRIHEKKGCDILINAFSSLLKHNHIPSNSILVMAGPCHSPEYLQELQKLGDANGLGDQILWTGMLEGKVKYGALYGAELFALPSHQENFGIAVAEALACGTPVITTKEVNIWREIEADHAGIITEDSQESFANGLKSFYLKPTVEQKELGKNATRCFENRFHINSAADDLYSILSSLQNSR